MKQDDWVNLFKFHGWMKDDSIEISAGIDQIVFIFNTASSDKQNITLDRGDLYWQNLKVEGPFLVHTKYKTKEKKREEFISYYSLHDLISVKVIPI